MFGLSTHTVFRGPAAVLLLSVSGLVATSAVSAQGTGRFSPNWYGTSSSEASVAFEEARLERQRRLQQSQRSRYRNGTSDTAGVDASGSQQVAEFAMRCKQLGNQLAQIQMRQAAVLESGSWSDAQRAEIAINFGLAQASLVAMLDRCRGPIAYPESSVTNSVSAIARPSLR